MGARPFQDIIAPVGRRYGSQNVTNRTDDQREIMSLLATISDENGGKQESWSSGMPDIGSKNGECPSVLATAIMDFQRHWKSKGYLALADGVVDPGKKTIKQLYSLTNWGNARDPTLRIPPEGQLDSTACWAACYAWWLKAFPGQTSLRQEDILALGAGDNIVRQNGLVSVSGYQRFLDRRHAPIVSAMVSPDKLDEILVFSDVRTRPAIVGFASSIMGGHVNVIHGFDSDRKEVSVMECWHPDPTTNPNYRRDMVDGQPIFVKISDGSPFVFTGKHLKRPLSFYTSRPIASGKIMIFPTVSI